MQARLDKNNTVRYFMPDYTYTWCVGPPNSTGVVRVDVVALTFACVPVTVVSVWAN